MAMVAVYVRMSTDKQEDSIERQLEQVRLYCASRGYSIYKVYEDQGLRGYDKTRPAFQAILQDARSRRFQGIVIDEPSRLSRDEPIDFISDIVKPLKDAGIWLESVTNGRQDWNSIGGIIVTTVNADTSHTESIRISSRVLSGWFKKLKEKEVYLGRAPYGYRFEVNDQGKRVRLVPDQMDDNDPTEPARVVRWMFETYVNTTASLKEIVRQLAARCVPTPQGGSWRPGTVYKILKSRVYVGDYVFNRYHSGKYHRAHKEGLAVRTEKQIRPGCKRRIELNAEEDWVVRPDTHEPLISRDLFARAQAKMAQSATRKASTTELNKYPFLRMFVCGHCGSWMVAHKKSSWEFPKYTCSSNHHFGQCRGYSVREDVAIEYVAETLEREFLDPAHYAGLEAAARAIDEENRSADKTTKLRKSIARLEASLKQAETNLAMVPPNRVGGILAKMNEWEQEKLTLENELTALGESVADELKQLIKQIRQVRWRWEEAKAGGDIGLVYELVRESISRVVFHFETRRTKRSVRHRISSGAVYFVCGKPMEFKGKSNPQSSTSTTYRRPEWALSVPLVTQEPS